MVARFSGELRRFEYRLGLSATPERCYDDDGNRFILEEIGPIIYRFSIEDAIRQGILCEFDYHPIEYELLEQDRQEIRRLIAAFDAVRKTTKQSMRTNYSEICSNPKGFTRQDSTIEKFPHSSPGCST